MSVEELMKKYKNVCKLEDGSFCVSTKHFDEVAPVLYWEAHTDITAVYGAEGKWSLVDKDGNVIIKPKYIYPFLECGDNYLVMMPHKYKIIDGCRTVVLLKCGLIDKKGNEIIPVQYLNMEAMDNTGTYFRVVDAINFKSGVLDKNNTIVVPFKYEYIQASPDLELCVHTKYGYTYPNYIYQVLIKNNDLYGVYDLKLKKEIIKPKYNWLRIIGYNRFVIGENYEACNTLIDEDEQVIGQVEKEKTMI